MKGIPSWTHLIPTAPNLNFVNGNRFREFAQKYGKRRLEEELDSGLLDLPSTLLAEQWLEDEPARKARKKAASRAKFLWALYIFLLAVILVAFAYFFATTNSLI